MRPIVRFRASLGALLLLSLAAAPVSAQVDIDNTCATCSRRQLDSLNLQPRNIRLNQVGYRPQDSKVAFINQASAANFSVVSMPDRRVVLTNPVGASFLDTTVGGMKITGYYNSIKPLYTMTRPMRNENLSRADFSTVTAPGTYVLVCGKDTSATFRIDARLYNEIFETALKFFGSNRCGKTDSWMHAACHLKDGDALGAARAGSLSGGWHDCGDHGKYGPTLGYAAAVLAMTYAFFPEKGEDFYGKSYDDTLPLGIDGIPDVLYEAKIGADYILKLYKASKTDGLIAAGDMYHTVGTGPGMDHQYWDRPEFQDVQPQTKGGPARPVAKQVGANVAGIYAATLAFFAWGWEPFDPAYAKECLNAAIDIFDNLVVPTKRTQTAMPCCYTGQGPILDDIALATLGLWFATKEKRYGNLLLTDPAQGTNPLSVFNDGEFPAGMMAYDLDGSGPAVGKLFHPGGWPTDYENVHEFVLYGLVKLIVGTPQSAAAYGIDATVADSLKKDALSAMRRAIYIASNGSTAVGQMFKVDPPYNGVFTSANWGFNRYNLGSVLNLFFYWDLTGSTEYLRVGLDNLNYNLGWNPWDISFVMGAGDKNLQHPHNRAANPEGYNAGGLPYKYRSPKGALMGGCNPHLVLLDEWEKYDVTETCVDFSAQLLIPTQMLAADIPPDREGPKFRNVNIFPEERTALVTWTTDEFSRDTLVLLDAPGGKVLQTVPAGALAKNKQVNLEGLTPNTTYYVYFKGVDVRGNRSEDRNGGAYWPFTTKSNAVPAQISDVRVCNETHESALVTWWTKNGEYSSQVDYGKTTALGQTQAPDDGGIPTRFHRVTVDSLDAATLYYFQVLSGAVKDDNGGKFYTFQTTQVLVDYTIRIKPTNKAANGQGTHFYIDVTNHELQPYTGLEIRFYFTADAATAGNLVAQSFDRMIFDAANTYPQLNLTIGKAVQVPGMADQWYFPITLNSTLPVAGRARFDLQVNTAVNGGSGNQPFSLFRNAWSIRAHASPPDPVAFEGVDLSKGETGVYKDPEEVVDVNGVQTVTYVETPYITAYYKGVHVYGYGPDYQADPLVIRRVMSLDLTQPVASPQDRMDLRQETGNITLSGRASSDPDGRVDHIIVNGENLPESQLTRATPATGGAVTFSKPVTLVEGTNVFDIIAWDTAHCAVESRKLIVNWRKAPPPPPPQAAKPVADPAGSAGRDSIVVGLTSATPGAAIWYTLDGKDPAAGAAGSQLYTGPIVIRNQAALKAIAVKAGYSPSEIMVENYDVFPFKVANIRSATLLDGNADGYADTIEVVLDTSLGAPVQAVVAGQLQGAKLTSGLVPGTASLAGTILRIPLAPNTLWVRNGAESLTVPPPSLLQDGMLRPGTFPLKDGIAPVLRRAILIQAPPAAAGVPAQPDTLLAAFSEPLQLPAVGPRPFTALRLPDGLAYDFALASGSPTTLPGLREGESAYRFVITGTPSAAAPAVPQAGDWVWILPTGNVADTSGNAQLDPDNARVPLQMRVALVNSIRGLAPEGYARIPAGDIAKPWTVYGGPNLQGQVGEPGAALPSVPVKPPEGHAAGLAIESTLPFAVMVRVHTTLGGYVGKVRLRVTEKDFALLPAGSAPGTRRLELLWNGRADNGNAAATGAYVYLWNLTFFPADKPPVSREGKSVFGILREP